MTTATKTKRIKNDNYPTPARLAESLDDFLQPAGLILEPCAGEGAIANQFRGGASRTVVTGDINPEQAVDFHADASNLESLTNGYGLDGRPAPRWIITNPPFSQAVPILENAWNLATGGVAFLLRLSFLEPTSNRRSFLTEHSDQLRWVIPVNPRPRFREDTKSNDSVTVAWFIWQKSWSWQAIGVDSPFLFFTQWN